jgi:hypothetical protein
MEICRLLRFPEVVEITGLGRNTVGSRKIARIGSPFAVFGGFVMDLVNQAIPPAVLPLGPGNPPRALSSRYADPLALLDARDAHRPNVSPAYTRGT